MPPNSKAWMLRTSAIHFAVGPAGAGAQPTWAAGATWDWVVHGRKEWSLWPPRDAALLLRHVTPALAVLGEGDGVAGPLRCEQRAGDVMVVPSSWGRAARHDEPTIGWVSEVAFDREHTDGFGEFYGTESWRGTEAEVVY